MIFHQRWETDVVFLDGCLFFFQPTFHQRFNLGEQLDQTWAHTHKKKTEATFIAMCPHLGGYPSRLGPGNDQGSTLPTKCNNRETRRVYYLQIIISFRLVSIPVAAVDYVRCPVVKMGLYHSVSKTTCRHWENEIGYMTRRFLIASQGNRFTKKGRERLFCRTTTDSFMLWEDTFYLWC
jgi:hypothetical protein